MKETLTFQNTEDLKQYLNTVDPNTHMQIQVEIVKDEDNDISESAKPDQL